jgi:thiosulfate dehydrogenase
MATEVGARRRAWWGVFVLAALAMPMGALAQGPERGEVYHRDYVFGVPKDPTEEWALASGGRMYDTWWEAIEVKEPEGTHSAYPATSKQSGAGTWRCKECHGWDYMGAAGAYATGSRATGIKGIRESAGKDPAAIAALLRGKVHGFTKEMIADEPLQRLALFVSKGQHDANAVIDRPTKKVRGNVDNGRKLYQNICAACHGFDGKALNFGDEKTPEYVGTVGQSNPWEMLHKIRNGHPGVPMPAWRAFEMSMTADVAAYTQTLPVK